MKRSIRRHQQQTAKLRRLHIFSVHWGDIPDKPWKRSYIAFLTEPGWHTHEFVVRPARVRSNRALRLVLLGRDPDDPYWPDYRKPHIYYW
jgi:hypothetical protein